MVIVEMSKTKIKFIKPIYVGFAILDISKTYIYDFHDNFIVQEFGDRVKLLDTDSDSLIYHFRVLDIYEIMNNHLDKFDTSNYLIDNHHHMPLVNKKVLSSWKMKIMGQSWWDLLDKGRNCTHLKTMVEQM